MLLGLSCATLIIPYNPDRATFPTAFFDNAGVLMRWATCMTLIVVLTVLGLAPGHADQRVALVIGNSAYRYVSPLPNPKNDAADIAASFERL
jgi:hypothetical protein